MQKNAPVLIKNLSFTRLLDLHIRTATFPFLCPPSKKNFPTHATFCTPQATHGQIERMTQLTDRFLVESFLLTRDETVFRWLYRRHQEAMWRFALRLTGGNEAPAADIVQDAWMRAIEKLSEFRWQSSLRTWLLGFVTFRTKEFWRSQLNDHQKMLPFEAAIFEWVEPEFNAEKMDLATAFAALPAGYRAVLTLHDIEGFKHEEIAELLQISVGTSKSQLSRGRTALRQFFDSETLNFN
jgi:RNA polymerase sigma-70 factor, ECF subfamily